MQAVALVLMLVLLQHSSDLQGVQLIGNLKFAVVVSLCMNGCLSVCVNPETNSVLSTLYPVSCHVADGIGSSSSQTLIWMSRRKQMDGCNCEFDHCYFLKSCLNYFFKLLQFSKFLQVVFLKSIGGCCKWRRKQILKMMEKSLHLHHQKHTQHLRFKK